MSRIGRLPIAIPQGVEVKLGAGNEITVKGPKGTLSRTLHPDMIVKVEGAEVIVERPSEMKQHKALHGLTRTLVNNMVVGVTEGYSKTLEINGVGYKAQKQGSKVVLNLGFSHNVEVEETSDIKIDVPNPNQLIISGIDKQAVGQFAAVIREYRLPEPYKGKGIKYSDETIIRKEGKTGKK